MSLPHPKLFAARETCDGLDTFQLHQVVDHEPFQIQYNEHEARDFEADRDKVAKIVSIRATRMISNFRSLSGDLPCKVL